MSYYQFSRVTQFVFAIGLCLYLISFFPSLWVRELLAIALGLAVFLFLFKRLQARARIQRTRDVVAAQAGTSTVGIVCVFALFSGIMLFFGVFAAYL